MRKRFKVKSRSCGLCKPHKRGLASRWNAKERALLVSYEREMLQDSREGLAVRRRSTSVEASG